jgi:tetratricopeptide (TPR) repeat protein
MIGVIMQDEASKILKSGGDKNKARELLMGKKIGVRRNGKPRYSSGALQHFLNVFVKYPNTSWAPDAGRRFREIKAQLADEWDIHTKAKISKAQMQAVEEAQFKEARVLFNQQRFKEAIDAYEQVLSLFPESDTSIAAMGELASCYIEEKEFMFADVVTRHLAERFCRNKKYMIPAGDRVVSIAYKYSEIGDKDRMRATYNTFFKYMTKHPRAAAEIYRFGNQEFAAKNYDAAMDYYKQIIEHHKDANVYTDALSRMAMIYDAQGKYKAEIKVLKVLIAILKKQDNPGQLLVSAMFRYARSLEALGPKYTDYAIIKYKALEKLLADKDARLAYQNSADEAKANIQILQAAMLKHAMADCKRKTVPPKVLAAFNKKYKRKVKPDIILNGYYKKNAIKILEKLVSEFPKSVYAPTALSQIGSLYTILKKPDDARKVLQRLQKDYPDSPEAKNVVFTLASSMLELGMRKEAINHFKQMFSGSGKFSASQILQAGKVLYDAEEYSTAIEAFDRVIKTEKSRAYLEPAKVRKALALNKLGKYDEAAKVFRSLLKDYPKSGYTVEICRGASEAYSAVAGKTADDTQRMTLFNEAIDALSRARKFAKDPGVKASLNIASAQISEDKSAAELQFGTKEKSEQYRNEAVAAYQSVIMFSDPKKKQLAPAIEEAYVRCLPLMMEMGRWDDVLQDADNYIKFFPHGKYNRKIRQFKNKARVSGGEAQKPADTEVDGGATTTSPDTTATTKEK